MIEIRHKETGEVLHRVRGNTLEGARLRHWTLVSADLRGANLQRADLYHADLTDADLEGARLLGVRGSGPPQEIRTLGWLGGSLLLLSIFVGILTLAAFPPLRVSVAGLMLAQWLFATSTGILLLLSMLGGVVWIIHVLAGRPRSVWPVKLSGAILRGADLSESALHESDSAGADLCGATIRAARLGRALLRRALLQHADLQSARLDGADLREADLRSARLAQASLRYADLRGADLRGADLRAQLDGAKLKGARYDETTRWPAAFQPAHHGAVTANELVPASVPQGRGDEPSPVSLPSAGSAPPAR